MFHSLRRRLNLIIRFKHFYQSSCAFEHEHQMVKSNSAYVEIIIQWEVATAEDTTWEPCYLTNFANHRPPFTRWWLIRKYLYIFYLFQCTLNNIYTIITTLFGWIFIHFFLHFFYGYLIGGGTHFPYSIRSILLTSTLRTKLQLQGEECYMNCQEELLVTSWA